ncbi:MalY/PatB family protein [Aquimarina mytili]|uniref:cysteine-S-conjugate beta-lyase n=1 Tax=Aquimarina mytili TaxID=874423 RepID=A0A936ZVW6_9FLAO|nr:PatB family C-S lyase [Aquimarina mytili]MBL0682898.1 PatB family C-S lyase [Aquimarina mytili]
MTLFNTVYNDYEHQFAKSNPNYLKSMFGTTDVVPFWIADMDFKVTEPITNELQRLVDRGIYAYEFNPNEVFKAIADWNLKRHQLQLNSKSFVQVSGVLTGIALLIRELSNEGDGILVQTPVYHQFYKLINTANRKIVRNPLNIVDGKYQMDFEDLEQKLRAENVKILLLCNPHNPVGRVWNQKELEKLIQLAKAYNITIISDEIHSDIIYSNAKFNSIASLSDKHIAILGSPAKTFGMQSISNGYLYIPNQDVFSKVKTTIESMYLDHGNAFSTFATIAAYTKGEDWVNELVRYLEKSVKWIQNFILNEIPQVKIFVPDGTYQIWLDFSDLNLSEDDLKDLVFNKAQLALTPGAWFDDNHQNFMRINIASPLSKLQDAFTNLKTAINDNT